MMTYDDVKKLQQKAADTIDTSWHHSLHWKKDRSGRLTQEGWKQAREDAIRELNYVAERRRKLAEVISEISSLLDGDA